LIGFADQGDNFAATDRQVDTAHRSDLTVFGPEARLQADGDIITVADLQGALTSSGASLAPGTIVLIRTDRDRYMGTREFLEARHWQGCSCHRVDD
jgi:Putative cyclase